MRHVTCVDNSFKAWENGNPYIHNPWHFHPECEITYIEKGEGVLYVGDTAVDYEDNMLLVFGPNLPHELRAKNKIIPDNYSKTYSIHFYKDFMGTRFLELPEILPVVKLLENATRGIAIYNSPVIDMFKSLMQELLIATGVRRVTTLLNILELIAADTTNITLLSSPVFGQAKVSGQDTRVNSIYKYVMENFKDQISLERLSEEFCMTPTSFCRFFKKRTSKSFIEYLNEVRVGYACKLMLEGHFTIAQVAYESGDLNLSNFHKQFKKIKKTTPSQFILQIGSTLKG
ncbi:AraC family transcriptional regulator [Pedobacter sp.]